jgi:hypothetical protein
MTDARLVVAQWYAAQKSYTFVLGREGLESLEQHIDAALAEERRRVWKDLELHMGTLAEGAWKDDPALFEAALELERWCRRRATEGGA